ncbi:hypothetical protein SPONL_39 [uncultured Candidatus Thioglobus sp.]|nr:hypothetical protein SPONL_39 [uncultured Candidatus Thioglobus sp.]
MFELIIMFSFVGLLLIAYYFSKTMFLVEVEIKHFASAGGSDYEKKSEKAKIPRKMSNIAKKEGLILVKVIGNSAQEAGINNNNIVAIKKVNDVQNLTKGDVIYLKYKKYPDKFKLREFISTNNQGIFSQTLDNGILRSSSHNIEDLVGVVKYNAVPR